MPRFQGKPVEEESQQDRNNGPRFGGKPVEEETDQERTLLDQTTDTLQGAQREVQRGVSDSFQTYGDLIPSGEELSEAAGSRSTFEAGGSMLGAGIGALAGSPTGPGAIGTSVVGGGIGAAAGTALYNAKEAFFGGEDEPETMEEVFFDPAQAAAFDMAFAGAGDLALKIGGDLGQKILGIGGKEAQKRIAAATEKNVPLGSFQVSEGASGRAQDSIMRVSGVFPIAGAPARKVQRKATKNFGKALSRELDGIAPSATMSDLGFEGTAQARKNFAENKELFDELYDQFENSVKKLPQSDIFKGTTISNQSKHILDDMANRVPLDKSGNPIRDKPKTVSDEVYKFIKENSNIAERQDIDSIRGIKQEANDLMDNASNTEIKYLTQIKEAAEHSINDPILDNVSPQQAREVTENLEIANKTFYNTMKKFETPTAKKFKRVDKNIFRSGAEQPGTADADEIMSKVFNTKSPKALEDLRNIVGDETYNKASRNIIEDRIQKSLTQTSMEGGGIEFQFDANKFKSNLGLDSKQGRQSLEQMLKGSSKNVSDFDKLSKIAEAIDGATVPDHSQFVARRMILGGAGAGASMFRPTFLGGLLLVNGGQRVITNPRYVNMLQKAVSDEVPERIGRQMIGRIAGDIWGQPSELEKEQQDQLREQIKQGPIPGEDNGR